ncbi:MAG: hypothetical protein CL678_06760 [Bdellovibrionaceae bacterium]|nr:hypothetical protein [Pseudobdellovibrionaceae bacterium]|tara:strand:- start:4354 stop:5013 length:660 start_codon:yes stop_codon:yes gene_type:complete
MSIERTPKTMMATDKKLRRRLTPEERKDELIEACYKVISKRGLFQTTVPFVVKAAGTSQGTFYHYFSDINDAFIQTARAVIEPILQFSEVADFSRCTSSKELESTLFEIYIAFADFLTAHQPFLKEVFFVARGGERKMARKVEQLLKQIHQRTTEVADRVNGVQPFRSYDSEIVAAAIVGMILYSGLHEQTGPASKGRELWAREMARFETGALVQGLSR